MNLSTEVMDAALIAFRDQAMLPGTIHEYNLRAALEAALPIALEKAWDDGWDALADFDSRPGGPYPTNPYRSEDD